MCSTEGLRLKEMGFLCQGQKDWKCVGETLPTGAGEWSGVASTGGHTEDGSFTCLNLDRAIR